MKVFFDTEFTGLTKDCDLISIGLITETNKKLYIELSDFDANKCDAWVMKNVVDKLLINTNHNIDHPYIFLNKTKNEARDIIEDWLKSFKCNIEMVSDVCHYDFVLFCDLFSGAMNLPSFISPACYDINMDIQSKYNISSKEAFNMSREKILRHLDDNATGYDCGMKHNSLYDAEIIKRIYYLIDVNHNTV